jgi:hypothetical protein
MNFAESEAIAIALQTQIDTLTELRDLERSDGIANPEIDALISASLSALEKSKSDARAAGFGVRR